MSGGRPVSSGPPASGGPKAADAAADVQIAPSVGTYPRAYEVDVALRDGSTVHVRPVRRDDAAAIEAFLDGLSAESLSRRFFGHPNLEWVTVWSTDVDYADRFGLVATVGRDHAVVAHAAYVRNGPRRAEIAFAVADEWQHHGIGTILLAHLAAAAEEHGITLFTGETLPSNHRMLAMLRASGFPVELRAREGTIAFEMPTSRSAEVRASFALREQVAAIAAVEHFLCPRSVAVVGASRRRRTVGGEILHNLLAGGFQGAVYPVNRNAARVQGQTAYRSLAAVPAHVELAVIAVPAEEVNHVAAECADADANALLVISAGFAEVGGEGLSRQRELLEICRDAGMRLIGPNCFGVLNTSEAVHLNATFAPHSPPPGRVGFLSQSGGLGIAIIESAGRLGLGLSSFVSVGNKADISGNDLLDFWAADDGTDLVMLYLESFGNPRRFSQISQRVSRRKPIVALSSGRSPAGARATSSHTGALVAASDVTVDALFRQAGVIRTDTMHELFDVGALLSSQPVPRGRRVAIVTNAGGPGILCADACDRAGLNVVELSASVRERLAGFLAAEAALGNPVDMIATATAESYRRTVEVLVQAQACDAIVAIFVPPLVTKAQDVARELHAAATTAHGVTLAAVFLNSEGAPPTGGTAGPGQERPTTIPCFEFPEDAAHALGHAARYAAWLAKPARSAPTFEHVRPEEAAAVIAEALSEGAEWLGPEQIAALFDCYQLPLIAGRLAGDHAQAVRLAAEIGRPVALKAVAKGLVHKSDLGAVRVGLGSAAEVEDAAREIEAAVADAGYQLDGLLVQQMAEPGVELLMGVVHDERFGPVVACGAGGTSSEVIADVAVRLTPVTALDAEEMLRSLRLYPLLEGYRGAPRSDLGAVKDVLLRLSALVDAHAEIVELDANPVIAGPHGAVIVDARVRVEQSPPRPPAPSLLPGR